MTMQLYGMQENIQIVQSKTLIWMKTHHRLKVRLTSTAGKPSKYGNSLGKTFSPKTFTFTKKHSETPSHNIPLPTVYLPDQTGPLLSHSQIISYHKHKTPCMQVNMDLGFIFQSLLQTSALSLPYCGLK